MIGRAIYHCPSDKRRNLILSMSGAASSSAMRLEDQFTEALAWLLDRDPEFARRFAHKYLEGDQEALDALDGSGPLGVSTQVRLPPLVPETTHLRPDPSLTAADRRLQLLVEVKVGADFGIGAYPTEAGERLDQVAAYVQSWETKTDLSLEATVRRVGTLTVRGDVPPRGALRAADLRWSEVADLLALEPVTPAVAAVAADLRALIEGMFGPVIAPPGFLDAGSRLAKDLADDLAAALPSPQVSRAHVFEPHADTGYAGGYVSFTTPADDREQLWIVVTASGSHYAEPGSPPSLAVPHQRHSATTGDPARA